MHESGDCIIPQGHRCQSYGLSMYSPNNGAKYSDYDRHNCDGFGILINSECYDHYELCVPAVPTVVELVEIKAFW